MKKVILSLLLVPVIFAACNKKQTASNSENNEFPKMYTETDVPIPTVEFVDNSGNIYYWTAYNVDSNGLNVSVTQVDTNSVSFFNTSTYTTTAFSDLTYISNAGNSYFFIDEDSTNITLEIADVGGSIHVFNPTEGKLVKFGNIEMGDFINLITDNNPPVEAEWAHFAWKAALIIVGVVTVYCQNEQTSEFNSLKNKGCNNINFTSCGAKCTLNQHTP